MNINIPDSIKQHIENLDTGIKYLNKFAKSYGPITRVLKFNVTVLDEEIYLELQATDGGFPKSEYYILGMRFIGYNMARTTFPRILYPRQDLGIPKFSVGDIENCKFSIAEFYYGKKILDIECRKIQFINWRTEIDEVFPED